VPNTKDEDHFLLHAIPDEIGANDRQFAMMASDGAATIRVLGKILGRRDQLQCETLGGKGAEFGDIVANRGQVGPRLIGPDYSLRLGGSNSLGVPQDSNQRFIASWLMTRPAAISASARASAAASASSSISSNKEGSGFDMRSV
jgi:hypothetical protein